MLNWFKGYELYIIYFVSYLGFGLTQDDALAPLGAKASVGMVLNPKSRNIPSPTSEAFDSVILLWATLVCDWKAIRLRCMTEC